MNRLAMIVVAMSISLLGCAKKPPENAFALSNQFAASKDEFRAKYMNKPIAVWGELAFASPSGDAGSLHFSGSGVGTPSMQCIMDDPVEWKKFVDAKIPKSMEKQPIHVHVKGVVTKLDDLHFEITQCKLVKLSTNWVEVDDPE